MKRKALVVSMMVAAGLPTATFAKGGGKWDRAAYAGHRPAVLSTLANDGRGSEAGEDQQRSNSGLLSLWNRMTWVEGKGWVEHVQGWKMEMLKSRMSPRMTSSDDPRLTPTKPVGLMLRYTF